MTWRKEAPTVEEVRARVTARLPTDAWWRMNSDDVPTATLLGVNEDGVVVYCGTDEIWRPVPDLLGEWGGWCGLPSGSPPAPREVIASVEGEVLVCLQTGVLLRVKDEQAGRMWTPAWPGAKVGDRVCVLVERAGEGK